MWCIYKSDTDVHNALPVAFIAYFSPMAVKQKIIALIRIFSVMKTRVWILRACVTGSQTVRTGQTNETSTAVTCKAQYYYMPELFCVYFTMRGNHLVNL